METTKRLIDRHARRLLHNPVARLKAKIQTAADDHGFIEGYAAVWGVVDKQNEVIAKGAFQRSISQTVPAGKVKLMAQHFRDGGDVLECLGTITDAKEDDYGLWIHADLSSVEIAQDVRTLVNEGHVKTLSVGFRPIKWAIDDKTQVLTHTECEFCETTVTVKPADDLAGITAAKSVAGSAGVSPALAAGTAALPGTAPANTGLTAGSTQGKSDPLPPSPSAKASADRPPVSHAMQRELVLKKARMAVLLECGSLLPLS